MLQDLMWQIHTLSSARCCSKSRSFAISACPSLAALTLSSTMPGGPVSETCSYMMSDLYIPIPHSILETAYSVACLGVRVPAYYSLNYKQIKRSCTFRGWLWALGFCFAWPGPLSPFPACQFQASGLLALGIQALQGVHQSLHSLQCAYNYCVFS